MSHLPAVAALALLAAPGCGSSTDHKADAQLACTDIGCGPTLRIRFERPSWPAGVYHLEVTADGATDSCDVTVPLACNVGSACSGMVDVSPELSGCALDPSQHAIAGVTFSYTVPMAVTVRVLQGERELGKGTFTPTYTTSQPNGSTCPPVCHSAPLETLTLPP